MNKLIVVMALFFIAPAYSASERQAACAMFGDFAELIMSKRQAGADMSELMALANGSSALKEAVSEMIIIAYGKPRYSTQSNIDNEIVDFKNEVLLSCYKNLK